MNAVTVYEQPLSLTEKLKVAFVLVFFLLAGVVIAKVDYSEWIYEARVAVTNIVMPTQMKTDITQQKENVKFAISLIKDVMADNDKLKEELSETKIKLVKAEAKLNNALVKESSVSEALDVHVVEPISRNVSEGWEALKKTVDSYEFKPVKLPTWK